MPLDLDEARRVGILRHVNQRQKYKSRVGVVQAAGDPFPLDVDTAKLEELGPGIPLYFALARHLHCLVGASAVLYSLLALLYFSRPVIQLDETGRRQWKHRELQRGSAMSEWMRGWYVGGCGTGLEKLWPEESFVGERATLDAVWMTGRITAATRGPWLGRLDVRTEVAYDANILGRKTKVQSLCPMMNLSLPTDSGEVLGRHSEGAQGTYLHCGRHGGLPWFFRNSNCSPTCGYVIFATPHGNWELAVWEPEQPSERAMVGIARTRKRCRVAKEFSLDTHWQNLPILAWSNPHGGSLPSAVGWMQEGLEIGHEDEMPSRYNRLYQGSSCDSSVPGIPAVQCIDVLVPCDGCSGSAAWALLLQLPGWRPEKENKRKVPLDVDILMVSFLSICLLCVGPPLIVRRLSCRHSRAFNHPVRASDFTVHVQGLKWVFDELDEGSLIEFLQETLDARYPLHYHRFPERGAHHIVKVTFIFRLGRLFRLLKRVKRTREMSERMQVVVVDLASEIEELRMSPLGLSMWQNFKLLLRLSKVRHDHKKAVSLVEKYERDQARCLESLGQERSRLEVTGAMVTFENAVAAKRCVEAFGFDFFGQRGVKRPDLFKGFQLRAREAPEPDDVVWKNFGEPEAKVLLLKTLTGLLMLAVMAVMCLVIYFLTRVKQIAALQKASSFTWVLIFRSMGPAIVFTDVLLREVVVRGVELEMPRSAHCAAVSAMWKHLAAGIFNSALACLFVHAERDEMARTCEVNWYLSGNLLDNAMAIATTNMVVMPFLLMFSPWGNNPVKSRLRLYFLDPKRSRMTQREVNELASGVEYRLAYRYASTIKTIFISFLYAPLAPMVMFAGLVSLILQYWSDKVCLLRTAQRPPWQDLSLGQHASFAIPLVLLPVPLLTVYLLRSTAPRNLVDWIQPCLPWSSGLEIELWQKIGIQLYLLGPAISIVVAFCIYGGIHSLVSALAFLRKLIVVFALLFERILRAILYSVTCGRRCQRRKSRHTMASFLRDDDPGTTPSYYVAQHFLPMKYHMCNPVYTVFAEDVNPENIPEPEPGENSRRVGGVGASMNFRSALEALVAGSLKGEAFEAEDAQSDAEETEPAQATVAAQDPAKRPMVAKQRWPPHWRGPTVRPGPARQPGKASAPSPSMIELPKFAPSRRVA